MWLALKRAGCWGSEKSLVLLVVRQQWDKQTWSVTWYCCETVVALKMSSHTCRTPLFMKVWQQHLSGYAKLSPESSFAHYHPALMCILVSRSSQCSECLTIFLCRWLVPPYAATRQYLVSDETIGHITFVFMLSHQLPNICPLPRIILMNTAHSSFTGRAWFFRDFYNRSIDSNCVTMAAKLNWVVDTSPCGKNFLHKVGAVRQCILSFISSCKI